MAIVNLQDVATRWTINVNSKSHPLLDDANFVRLNINFPELRSYVEGTLLWDD